MIKDLDVFLKNLQFEIDRCGLVIEKTWFIDHICYRAASEGEYKSLIADYKKNNELLIEAPVGGRLISTFKLKDPISFRNFKIPLIEIPMPKLGRETKSGYEHIEIVIQEDFGELQNRYSHLSFLTHALTKELNPELEIELNNCSIKFHHQSLEKVIEFEKGLM